MSTLVFIIGPLLLILGTLAICAVTPNLLQPEADGSKAKPPRQADQQSESWLAAPAVGRTTETPKPNLPVPKAAAFPARADLPSQDGWARRAGQVRDPLRGFVFRVQAGANAKAMDAEQRRVKAARAALKEYAGLFEDMAAGQDAATAYAIRRDMAAEFYDQERLRQEATFAEATHQRRVAEKRREKELTEAQTRRIEALHEQEALERFKEPKFAAGFARFEAKSKEHLVGAAAADAAIAETKGPTEASPKHNESEEVIKLCELLRQTLDAIEEGERVGRDTQALRERVQLYKKLLNLS